MSPLFGVCLSVFFHSPTRVQFVPRHRVMFARQVSLLGGIFPSAFPAISSISAF